MDVYGKNATPHDQWNAYIQHVHCMRRSLQAAFIGGNGKLRLYFFLGGTTFAQ